MQETVGQKLKRLREAAGLSQDEMATRIGISRESITNYERGKTVMPVPVLLESAKTLGIPLGVFQEESVSDLTLIQVELHAVMNRANELMRALTQAQRSGPATTTTTDETPKSVIFADVLPLTPLRRQFVAAR